ncbi:MAG: AsmA family protein [Candidatus Aquirickettsiella gammari]
MLRILRIFITLVGAIILLGLVALIGLVVFVNPNDLKPQINQAVTKFTGRQLLLRGDIKWSIFPWLGLQLNDAKLSNNPGFGDNPFAQIKKLDIQVRLLPLLHKQLEIGRLQIRGLTLYLIKNAKGQGNWEGLVGVPDKMPSNPNSRHVSNNLNPIGFIVTGLSIRDGHILFTDQQKNQHLDISDLQLKSTNLTLNQSSPFDIQFSLHTNSPNINAAVKLRSYITLSGDKQNIEFNKFSLNTLLKGPNYPKGELAFSINSHVDVNLKNASMTVDPLTILIDQTKLTGHVIGQDILNNPSFTGTLNSQQIKSGKLSFQQVQLAFQLKNAVLSLNPITAQLYRGNYQGDAHIDLNPNMPRIIMHNQFNQINTQLLFQDLINNSQLQLAGLATLNLNLTTQGSASDTLIRNLKGEGHFNLTQGSIKGINLSYWIAFGKALIKHEATPNNSGSTETPFDKFTASFNINQGIVSSNDLIIRSGRLRVSGKGELDLPQQQINYELQAQPILADGNPDGIAIPIKISGPLQSISISPVISQLSIDFVKEKLKGKLGDTLKKLDLKNIFQ